MRTRRTLTVAATASALVLTAGTAFAAGATTSQDGTLLRNPANAMSAAMSGSQPAPMHDEASTPMHRDGMPMDEADHDAMHRDADGHMGGADHDAMHSQMREHMPSDLRGECDAHHGEGAEPDA